MKTSYILGKAGWWLERVAPGLGAGGPAGTSLPLSVRAQLGQSGPSSQPSLTHKSRGGLWVGTEGPGGYMQGGPPRRQVSEDEGHVPPVRKCTLGLSSSHWPRPGWVRGCSPAMGRSPLPAPAGLPQPPDGDGAQGAERPQVPGGVLPREGDPALPLHVPDRPVLPRGRVGLHREDRGPLRGFGGCPHTLFPWSTKGKTTACRILRSFGPASGLCLLTLSKSGDPRVAGPESALWSKLGVAPPSA